MDEKEKDNFSVKVSKDKPCSSIPHPSLPPYPQFFVRQSESFIVENKWYVCLRAQEKLGKYEALNDNHYTFVNHLHFLELIIIVIIIRNNNGTYSNLSYLSWYKLDREERNMLKRQSSTGLSLC